MANSEIPGGGEEEVGVGVVGGWMGGRETHYAQRNAVTTRVTALRWVAM